VIGISLFLSLDRLDETFAALVDVTDDPAIVQLDLCARADTRRTDISVPLLVGTPALHFCAFAITVSLDPSLDGWPRAISAHQALEPPGPSNTLEQSERLAAANDTQTAVQGVLANALLFSHFFKYPLL
jgi:hypothetical protein